MLVKTVSSYSGLVVVNKAHKIPYNQLAPLVASLVHSIPYDQRALYFFKTLCKYKLPEVIQKSNTDIWEFWRAGNAVFQSVNLPFYREADKEALLFNRITSIYETSQILQSSTFSKYWQPAVIEDVNLSHYGAADIVYKGFVVPVDFRHEAVSVITSSYNKNEIIGDYRAFSYAGRSTIIELAVLSHYDAADIVYKGFVVPADFRHEAVSVITSSYNKNEIIGDYRAFSYAGRALIDAAVISRYYAIERVSVAHLAAYDMLEKNKASVQHTISSSFVADHQFLIMNPQTASIVTTIGTIDPLRLQVSTSMGENIWQISASLSFDEAAKARINSDAIVNAAGMKLDTYFVAKNTRKTATSKQVDVELYTKQRRLTTMPLDGVYTTSKALFDAAGVKAAPGVPMSPIALTNTDKTSFMAAVSGVASDIGAAVAMRGNDLVVIPVDRPSGVVWQLGDDDLLELSETFVDGVGYNAVIVSDAGDGSSDSISTDIETVGDHWMLYVYGASKASVTHTQIDAYVSITRLGTVTLKKTEQVEFKEGVATVAKPISSIVNIRYLSDSLPGAVFSGNRIVAGGVNDYALANVTYTTKPLAFRVIYNKVEALQLVIEGE